MPNNIIISINKHIDEMKESAMKKYTTSRPLYRNRSFVGAILKSIKFGMSVQTERKDLLKLDNDRLRDIGVSCKDALREAQRSFADLPLERVQAVSGLQKSGSKTPICELCGRRFITAE